MKKYIILLFIFPYNFCFGQASGGGSVELKIFFDKEISIQNIEVFYIEDGGSRFDNIGYIKNPSENFLIVKGYHSWWGAPSFQTITFRYNKNGVYHYLYLYPKAVKKYVVNGWEEEFYLHVKKPNITENDDEDIIYYTVTTETSTSDTYSSETEQAIEEKIRIDELER